MRNVRTNLSLKSLPQSKKNTSRLWKYFLQHIKFFSCANVYGVKFEVRCCAMKSRATRRSFALKKAPMS